MTQDPDNDDEREAPKRPRVSRWAIFRSVSSAVLTPTFFGVCGGGLLAVFHPDTPLPPPWNPTVPLNVAHPVSPLTTSKLRMALNDPVQCRELLGRAAQLTPPEPFEVSENCHVRNRVALSAIGSARIDRIEISCATALRIAMWEQHGVQPAARDILGKTYPCSVRLAATTAAPFTPPAAMVSGGAHISPPTQSTSQGLISPTGGASV